MLVSLAPRRLAVLLPAAVVLVAVVLHLWWPAGVVLGVVLGVLTVLTAGASQQRVERRVEVDEDVERALGFAVPRAADHRPAQRSTAVRRPAARAVARPAAPAAVVAAPAAARPAAVAPVVAAPEPLPVVAGPDLFAEAPEPESALAADTAGVRSDLQALKAQLGDDWPDFARAARLVVETQYASAARLQRDLQLPYSRARRLLAGLETEHFVGPATGSLPRQVLMPKDALPEVERLLAAV